MFMLMKYEFCYNFQKVIYLNLHNLIKKEVSRKREIYRIRMT